ncbi:hypothetical protein HYG77_38645 (plasmid) [Rhodococcus sp. ZPP]|nr:hypothetical protein HYG77_38645 [Rhodococcus sp. ZPP]
MPEPVAPEPAATSPVAPATTAPSATPTATPQQRKASAPARQPAEKKRKAQTTDILLSLEEELKDRMVAALEHTRPRTGIKSQQVFIRTAIDQLCARLENQYNNGEPFPAPADEIAI